MNKFDFALYYTGCQHTPAGWYFPRKTPALLHMLGAMSGTEYPLYQFARTLSSQEQQKGSF
jgi:hypothetical protein